MPKTLRNTTCEDIFDFETLKDAICNVCISLMDPLTSQKRRKKNDCEITWDAKWITNRHKNAVKGYSTDAMHMKDMPEVELCDETACPSVISTTTTTTTTTTEEN